MKDHSKPHPTAVFTSVFHSNYTTIIYFSLGVLLNNNNNNILLFILLQFQAKKPDQRRST